MHLQSLVLAAASSLLLVACPTRGPGGDDDDATDDDDDAGSAGCGIAAAHAAGGVQITLDLGAGGERGFWLSLPTNYDPEAQHKVVVGYAGTNWAGQQIQPYLNLEDGVRGDEIFVYPDPLWWDFGGWGTLGGWLLGPYAYPADGDADLVLTEAVLDWVETNYCVDTGRVFATGHSWGGDMAAVAGCFLGERFTAVAPVAANQPYWFRPDVGVFDECTGDPAVWTWFGQDDDHFNSQAYPGEYGDEQVAFWLAWKGCDGSESSTDLGLGTGANECVEYTGCSAQHRYCLYGPASGHQVPSYYSATTIDWFRSF
jgi:polyhydroxybutyrate depolymerase